MSTLAATQSDLVRSNAAPYAGYGAATTVRKFSGYEFGPGEAAWVRSGRQASARKSVPAAMADLYDAVDDLLRAGNFAAVDRGLAEVSLADLKPELWVALLTVTYAAKDRLRHRAAFAGEVQRALQQMSIEPESVLHGLL